MVDPFQDQSGRNPGSFHQFGTALAGSAAAQQVYHGLDAGIVQLPGIDGADPFYEFNLLLQGGQVVLLRGLPQTGPGRRSRAARSSAGCCHCSLRSLQALRREVHLRPPPGLRRRQQPGRPRRAELGPQLREAQFQRRPVLLPARLPRLPPRWQQPPRLQEQQPVQLQSRQRAGAPASTTGAARVAPGTSAGPPIPSRFKCR